MNNDRWLDDQDFGTPIPKALPQAIDVGVFQKNALNNLYKMPAGEKENTVVVPFKVESAPYAHDDLPPMSEASNAEISITDLWATRPEVAESSVKTAIESPVQALPLVVHTKGKFYIQSGLASAVASYLMGDSTVSAKLLSL